MKYLFTLIVMFWVTGCATTSQNVPVATTDNLETGNALILVNRPAGFLGSGRSVEVTDNGKIVGKVSSGKMLSWQREAGPFVIKLVESFGAVVNPKPIDLNVVAGETYRFEVFMNDDLSFDLRQN